MTNNNEVTAAALTGLKLPFRFDPALLKHDLALISSDEWSPHYNEREFGGQWQGVALRSAAGSHRDILAGNAGRSDFTNTLLLERCTYFREVLSAFQCPLKSVRLLSLAPGSFIREHSDRALGYEDGEIRIHIPIQTNTGVEFYVCGERLLLEEGECYYVNVNLPHRVNNRGLSSRIHLVIDAEVNDWVDHIFREKGRPIKRSALPPGNLEEFRNLVFREESLREMLRGISDRGQFIERTIVLGRERGFNFHESDIDAGFRSRPTVLSHAPAGWTPVKVGLLEAEWVFTGGRRFTEPFFEDTVRAFLRHPFAALFRVA
ncbi:MAG: Aspartyl/Asparaginyl beta-hydroxylase, partial [Bryobacterales bacterium]|nr:Aspartyl/Asparaginyl beta-hydroxylase [Bryobacterales bacterium]